MTDQLAINESGEIVSQPLTSDGQPMYSEATVREAAASGVRLFDPGAFEQMRGQLAMKPELRERTVFDACASHAHLYRTECRERRAEAFVEGGFAECADCRFKPGTDFYCAEFVAEHPGWIGIQG